MNVQPGVDQVRKFFAYSLSTKVKITKKKTGSTLTTKNAFWLIRSNYHFVNETFEYKDKDFIS